MLGWLLGKLPVASIVGAAFGQAAGYVRQEVEYAREEFRRKVKGIIGGTVLVTVAVTLLSVAIVLLIIAGVAGLSIIWPLWLSALVAGGGVLLLALIFLAVGISKIKRNSDLRPERAMDAWARFSSHG